MLTEKENEKNVEHFLRIVKHLSSVRDASEMVEYIVSFFESKSLFSKAEGLVVKLDLSRTTAFLEKWH
jgi:hypothetical protein